THSELVGHYLIDGVDKTRKWCKGGGFGYHENPYITKVLQYREYPTEEARAEAYRSSNEAWEHDENVSLARYIGQKVKEPQKTAKQRREERIAELQEELRRLTEQQEYEKRQEQETAAVKKPHQNTEVTHEISES
ncbi:MAG: hypothetical protein M3275_14705, partial [Thermoproteota archaeon]|nr:hypothetical protein [Thermoproteota archaeon]